MPFGHAADVAPTAKGRLNAPASAAAPPACARRVTTRRRDALAPSRIANASNVLLSIAEPPAQEFASPATPFRGRNSRMDPARPPRIAKAAYFFVPDSGGNLRSAGDGGNISRFRRVWTAVERGDA